MNKGTDYNNIRVYFHNLKEYFMINLADYSENSQPFDKYYQKIENTESGQGLVEYALIFALVVVLLIVLLYFFGDRMEFIYQSILDKILSL